MHASRHQSQNHIIYFCAATSIRRKLKNPTGRKIPSFRADIDSDRFPRPVFINHCEIIAKSLSALKFTINESMFYLDIELVLSFGTESAFSEHFFISLQNTFELLLLRLDNVGLKTTPNTLDWHLLALFAGRRLKVTYQGFDSHPDTYFTAPGPRSKTFFPPIFSGSISQII